MENNFKAGDLVRRNCDGPQMEVLRIKPGDWKKVICAFYSPTYNKTVTEEFHFMEISDAKVNQNGIIWDLKLLFGK